MLLPLIAAAGLASAVESSSPRYKNTRAGEQASSDSVAAAPSAQGSAHFSTTLRERPLVRTEIVALAGPAPLAAPRRHDWRTIATGMAAGAAAGLGVSLAAWRSRRRSAARRSADLAVLAHELKTPLSAIESYLDLMVHEGAAADTKQARQWLEDARHLKSTAAQLRQTLTELLEAAQLESGKLALKRERLDAAALAAEAVRLHGPSAEAAGVRLALQARPQAPAAHADRLRLAQVFSNLLSNALKFTPRGGEIAITVDAGQHAGAPAVVCAVTDTGPGIGSENHGRLFKKFSRLGGREDGAGLGLYVARTIVEAHGGRIWVESQPGAGSRFSFAIPAAADG